MTRDSGKNSAIRIAIADDHPIFRDSLRRLLLREPGFDVVAEAADGDEVFQMVEKYKPDILLLDLIMPEVDGLSVLRRLHSQRIRTKVIVLTVAEDEKSHLLAMRYGASGIVVKSYATQFLVEGIRKVHDGQLCLDEKTMVSVMRQFASPRKPAADLSEREKEVVALVCEGLKNKEIAERLFISEDTVKTHLRHIFEKTGVSDRMQLVLYAFESDLPLMSDNG